jgi:hypothetical protein
MYIDAMSLGKSLQHAFQSSCTWVNAAEHSPSNSLRSCRFCSDVGSEIHQLIEAAAGKELTRRQISVSDSGRRQTGEWLLDIVWTEDCRPDARMKDGVPAKIWCAVECESNTSARQCFRDLSKLLHVRSSIKIFLGGLNQRTEKAAKSYKNQRLQQIRDLIMSSQNPLDQTQWFVGFWPSPAGSGASSMWNHFHSYPHLDQIYLYSLDVTTSGFISVEPRGETC